MPEHSRRRGAAHGRPAPRGAARYLPPPSPGQGRLLYLKGRRTDHSPAPHVNTREAEPRGANSPGLGLRPPGAPSALAVWPSVSHSASLSPSDLDRESETTDRLHGMTELAYPRELGWPMRSGDQGPRWTAPAPRSCFDFQGSHQARSCPQVSACAVPCPHDAVPHAASPTPASLSSDAASPREGVPCSPTHTGRWLSFPTGPGRPTPPGCSVAPTNICHHALSLRGTPGPSPAFSPPVVCPVNRCEHSGPHLADEATRSSESSSHLSAATQLLSAVQRPAERGRKLATELASQRPTPGSQQLCSPCALARGGGSWKGVSLKRAAG